MIRLPVKYSAAKNASYDMRSKAAMKAYDKGYRVVGCAVLNKRGRPRKLAPNSCGYPRFNIRQGYGTIQVLAHHLTAWQKFKCDCIGDKVEIMHEDDDVKNFAPDNIKLGTKSQNSRQRGKRMYAAYEKKQLTEG